MPTASEKAITQKRQGQGILRPLLEEMFRFQGLEIANDYDVHWLQQLATKIVEREKVRTSEQGVFSPSGLASCLRQVYLGKNWKALGLQRQEGYGIETRGYFAEGTFKHLKWQYALYKLSHFNPEFLLLDVEVPVMSKRKDHGGTLDALVVYKNIAYVVDFKGLNVRAFGRIVNGDVPLAYRIQLADYVMLWNSTPGVKFKIETGILLAENKGGPDPKHPLAIHEADISLKTNLPEVRRRLEVLRGYEKENEIPPAECTRIGQMEFQSCPFSEICRVEVKRAERKTKRIAREDAERPRVAIPSAARSNSSRRPRPRR
jgi:hypothetical protein